MSFIRKGFLGATAKDGGDIQIPPDGVLHDISKEVISMTHEEFAPQNVVEEGDRRSIQDSDIHRQFEMLAQTLGQDDGERQALGRVWAMEIYPNVNVVERL